MPATTSTCCQAIVAELDPTRPYWPGSPYSGDPAIHPNDPSHGVMHIWDVWNSRDYTDYRTYSPRFVAEFGYQAPPAMATLRRALDDADLSPYSEAMLVHQKAEDGNLKLERGLADALRRARRLRRLALPHPAQPGAGAAAGHRALPVALPFVHRHCGLAAQRLLAVGELGRRRRRRQTQARSGTPCERPTGPPGDGAAARATAWSWRSATTPASPGTADLVLQRLTFDGAVLASATLAVSVGARGSVVVDLPPEVANAEDPKAELIVVGSGEDRALWFFERDRDLAYAPAAYDAVTEQRGDLTTVTVTARTLLRDLCLFPDRCDPGATVDRALVTLLPGESATFTVHHACAVEPETLTRRPVLRCVNDRSQSPG